MVYVHRIDESENTSANTRDVTPVMGSSPGFFGAQNNESQTGDDSITD